MHKLSCFAVFGVSIFVLSGCHPFTDIHASAPGDQDNLGTLLCSVDVGRQRYHLYDPFQTRFQSDSEKGYASQVVFGRRTAPVRLYKQYSDLRLSIEDTNIEWKNCRQVAQHFQRG